MVWPPKRVLVAIAAFLGGAWLLRKRAAGPTADPELELEPLDDYAPKELATSCDPVPKPGVKLFRQWALSQWGERPGSPENIIRACSSTKSDEHQEGRAWDLMVTSIEHGQQIVDALTANDNELLRRAGVMYMIFNRRMWRAYAHGGNPPGSWGPYDTSKGQSPHTDHVHFSFGWPGARGETSLYPRIRKELGVA